MVYGYIVKYFTGRIRNNLNQLWVMAHDEQEAHHNCVIQAKNRHGQGIKINILEIKQEINDTTHTYR
jgi:hypothetical protein